VTCTDSANTGTNFQFAGIHVDLSWTNEPSVAVAPVELVNRALSYCRAKAVLFGKANANG